MLAEKASLPAAACTGLEMLLQLTYKHRFLILVLCVSTPVSKAASEAQIKQFTRTETALAAGGVVTPQRLPQPRQGFWDGQEML